MLLSAPNHHRGGVGVAAVVFCLGVIIIIFVAFKLETLPEDRKMPEPSRAHEERREHRGDQVQKGGLRGTEELGGGDAQYDAYDVAQASGAEVRLVLGASH